jgi:hypothetical protein
MSEIHSKEDQLNDLFIKVRISHERFLRYNEKAANHIIPNHMSNHVTVYEEGTHWQEVCSLVFLAMYEAWEKCIKMDISGRGGKVFSLFRHSSDDGSFTEMQRGPFIVVTGEEEYGFQISKNTEDNGDKTWKVNPIYVGSIVKRFIDKTPTRFPKFVPCEGFNLKSSPNEFALSLLNDYEGDDSIYSTNKKVSESIETSKNLLVHFCSGKNEISFNQDVMKIIQSELKVVMCSPENFMTDFQIRLYKAGILKLEDFLS